jgi:steroid delta-isomerase-like uncharacterized protein
MSIEAKKALLKRYADAVLSGHDLAAMDEFFHADYVQEDPPDGMGPGRDGLRQWLATWMQAFPDVRWTVQEQVGEGDQVWSRSTWEGTHQGPYLGIPPSGRKVTAAVWTINRIADDKIAAGRMLGDRLGLIRQLGVIPERA